MNNQLSFLIFLCYFIFLGCTSTQLSGSSDDEKQYEVSLRKLQKGKLSEKNKKLLSTSVTKILATGKNQKDTLSSTLIMANEEQSYAINQSLISRLDKAKSFLSESHIKELNFLEEEQRELKKELKEYYFNKGKANLALALENEDKSKSKEASRDFRKSLDYGMADKEVKELQQKSFDYSHIVYNVITKPQGSQKYKVMIDDTFRDVEQLQRRFKKIYFDKGETKGIDCTIELYFDPLSIVDDYKVNTKDFQKSVQTGTRTEGSGENQKTVPVVELVRGSVAENITIKRAQWRIRANVYSNSKNCTLESRYFQEELVIQSVEIRIRGDQRAIPARYLNFARDEIMENRQIAEELLERIYIQLKQSYI